MSRHGICFFIEIVVDFSSSSSFFNLFWCQSLPPFHHQSDTCQGSLPTTSLLISLLTLLVQIIYRPFPLSEHGASSMDCFVKFYASQRMSLKLDSTRAQTKPAPLRRREHFRSTCTKITPAGARPRFSEARVTILHALVNSSRAKRNADGGCRNNFWTAGKQEVEEREWKHPAPTHQET